MEEVRITRLREKTGCSQDKAREALAQGDGSLLAAILYLEEKSHVKAPVGGGFFSSKEEQTFLDFSELTRENEETPVTFFSMVKMMFAELFLNQFEIWYKERFLLKIPVFLMIILMPATYGGVFAVLIFPMFFGMQYRFSKQGSFLAEFNPVLQRMSTALFDLKRKRKNEKYNKLKRK